MQGNTCFITGHRPHRFKFGHNENDKLCIKIKNILKAQILRQYTENNVQKFWVGGAIGADCWAGEIILELKKQNDYRDIELFAALPFPAYNEKFDKKEKARWRDILNGCTDSVTVCESYSMNAYRRRNYYMVDRSQYGIAVYDNDNAGRSGTGMTVNYAVKKKLSIILIHPDTAKTMISVYSYE
ncbi:MAG: SLOG family protein [Clostridia bacterium]